MGLSGLWTQPLGIKTGENRIVKQQILSDVANLQKQYLCCIELADNLGKQLGIITIFMYNLYI